MPIYIRCPNCKSDQNIKNKKCKKCGNSLPKQAKTYRVVVKYAGKTITKCVPNSLELAREIESKIKVELVEDSYFDRRKRIPTLDEVWVKYIEWAKENKKSWRDDEYRYNYLLKERFGNKALDQISPLEIERFKLDMKKINNARGKPYTPATMLQYLALLRSTSSHFNLNNSPRLKPVTKANKTRLPACLS